MFSSETTAGPAGPQESDKPGTFAVDDPDADPFPASSSASRLPPASSAVSANGKGKAPVSNPPPTVSTSAIGKVPVAPDGSPTSSAPSSPVAMQSSPSPIDNDEPSDAEDYERVDVGAQPRQLIIDYSKYAALAAKIAEDGWLPLIQEAFDDEMLTRSKYILHTPFEDWWFIYDEVLCCMDPDVILKICSGNLANAYEESKTYDTMLMGDLDKYRKRADEHPSIYIRIFCDKGTHEPLSVDCTVVLAMHVRAYAQQELTHKDVAYQLDHVLDKNDNERWYLQTKGKNTSKQRVKNMQVFADKLEKQVAGCKDRDEQSAPLMQYVSYALDMSARHQQHVSYSSTNFLCMFVQALAEEWGGPISKILLTRLARAYYHTGGFSIDQAGKCMKKLYMDKLMPDERQKVWAGCLDWELRDLEEKGRAFAANVTLQDQAYVEMIKDLDREFMKENFPEEYESLVKFERDLAEQHRALDRMNAVASPLEAAPSTRPGPST
ncbi:hypothetical protein K458DRAFT_388988 [Lentithecium fluviatile CBS 122367]|uniref:Uncharacterized protein n=1 Tax=Lentithecium fluviatile CBS 122367 TaxID=1168545 RepID=A0A6G1J302_9PLEO|nr:hypothetical protein K458DRAFT_388988 [Lentithecium fluviatile CBS 122367]